MKRFRIHFLSMILSAHKWCCYSLSRHYYQKQHAFFKFQFNQIVRPTLNHGSQKSSQNKCQCLSSCLRQPWQEKKTHSMALNERINDSCYDWLRPYHLIIITRTCCWRRLILLIQRICPLVGTLSPPLLVELDTPIPSIISSSLTSRPTVRHRGIFLIGSDVINWKQSKESI